MADNINGKYTEKEKYLGDSLLWSVPNKKLRLLIKDGAIHLNHLNKDVLDIIDPNGLYHEFPKIIDNCDSTSPTDALSANMGNWLYSLIKALEFRLDTMDITAPRITLDPNELVTVPASGVTCTYEYFTEGVVGTLEFLIEGTNGGSGAHITDVMDDEDYDSTGRTRHGWIYVTIDPTQNFITGPEYTLIVKGTSNGYETTRAEASIKQKVYTRQIVGHIINADRSTLVYASMIPGQTGGIVSPTFTGSMSIVYDVGPTETTTFSLTDSIVEYKRFSAEFTTIGISEHATINESTGDVYADSTVITDEDPMICTVTLQYRINGVDYYIPYNASDPNATVKVYQTKATEQIVSTVYSVDSFTYNNLPNNLTGTNSVTPTISMSKIVTYNTGRTSTTQGVDFRSLNPTFTFKTPTTSATINGNGVVSKDSPNRSNNPLTYQVVMTFPQGTSMANNKLAYDSNVFKQEAIGISYGPVVVNLKYPNISYDGGSSTPKVTSVTQTVNGQNETVSFGTAGVSVSEAISRAGLSNVSFSLNGTYLRTSITNDGVISTDDKVDSPSYRDINVLVTATRNGVTSTSSGTAKQDTISRYIWIGYSEFIPDSFENREVEVAKYLAIDVYNGDKTAVVDTVGFFVDDYRVFTHWLIIPKNSQYTILSALDEDNYDLWSRGHMSTRKEISDQYGRSYYLWHFTSSRGIINNTTTFKITK